MKSLIIILSSIITSSLFGQITFEPTFINQCTNQIDDKPLWTITDSTKTKCYWPDPNNSNQATLPKPGNYNIYINFDTPIEFTINEIGINKDTFFTKRLSQKVFSKNTSFNYFDCDSIAHGKITDYCFNGKTRMKGTLKKGQPIDSLFSFARNGQLTEVFIPKKKGWKKTTYFKNGKIKSEESRSKKNKLTHKEYFPNGILKRNGNHKTLTIYNQNKVVVEKMKRKEILIFERLFAKKKHGRDKFYKYTWESFDDRGIIKRKIIFDSDHFNQKPFPDSIRQINDFLFEQIIFYFNGKEFKKVAIDYDVKNNFSKKLVVYRKEEKGWAREKTTSINKVYEMIDHYSN